MILLLLLPLYLLIALIVIWKVIKRVDSTGKKWGAFFLLVFAFYLPLGWDVILGRAYFHYLCETQGGLHVYQTVELGPEYWNEDGSPKLFGKGRLSMSVIDGSLSDGKYKAHIFQKASSGNVLSVMKSYTRITDTESGEVLGEIVFFSDLGGWFVRNTGFFVTGKRCPVIKGGGFYPDLVSAVFNKT